MRLAYVCCWTNRLCSYNCTPLLHNGRMHIPVLEPTSKTRTPHIRTAATSTILRLLLDSSARSGRRNVRLRSTFREIFSLEAIWELWMQRDDIIRSAQSLQCFVAAAATSPRGCNLELQWQLLEGWWLKWTFPAVGVLFYEVGTGGTVRLWNF